MSDFYDPGPECNGHEDGCACIESDWDGEEDYPRDDTDDQC
ncbi:hypothetical protein [Nocardia sp. NPDC050435]